MLQPLPPLEGKESQAEQLLSSFAGFCTGTRALPDFCEKPHQEMCDELEACIPDFATDDPDKKHEIYLAPRYSYKTSILVAFICFCVLKYANIRILLGRASHKDAKGTLFKVKQTLQSLNPKIREVWGDIGKGAPQWTETQITHRWRTLANQEPTVDTAGIGIAQTGNHPDLILLDDLVTELNWFSDAIIMRTREWVTSFVPILPPHGSIVVCGTRWAGNDIYQWLMENDDEADEEARAVALEIGMPDPGESRIWRRYIRRVVERGEDGTEVYFFPTKLDAKFLAGQKRELRHDMRKYGAWYFQQPYEEGVKLFNKEDLQFFGGYTFTEPAPMLALDEETNRYDIGTEIPMNVSMTIDPAPTNNKKSDANGIVIVGCDYYSNWWVLHGEGVRKAPAPMAEYVARLIARYGVSICSIETGQADPEFVARLQTIIKDQELGCAIVSYSALQDEIRGERGKDQRIHAVSYKFVDRQVWIRRGAQCRDLLSQLDNWPTVDHDDVLDALSMQRHVARPSPLRESQDLDTLVEAVEEADSWGPDGPPSPAGPRVHSIPGTQTGRGFMTLRGPALAG